MCIFCPGEPPEKVASKGAKGQQYGLYLSYQNNPNNFALPLKDACCTEPCCCIISGLGTPCGFTACWARSRVLETYYQGAQDFTCFQGYIPSICCVPVGDACSCCNGSMAGVCFEGCCCPVLSLSIARIHLMNTKGIRPDPCDYQIIQFANFLQLLSCIFDIVAIFVEAARDAALILDLIADFVTYSVGGCMGAQVYHETNKDKKNGNVTVQGTAVGQPPVAVARPVGGPVMSEMMER